MKFIKVKVSFQSMGSHHYPSLDILLNTDVIFLVKGENIVLKPDFVAYLSQSTYGDARIKVQSVIASHEDIKTLSEQGKV